MELLYRDIVLKIHRTNVYTAKNGSYIYSGLKQFIWLTRGGPSACRLGEGLTTPHWKKTSWLQNVTQGLWTWDQWQALVNMVVDL
jgi:hypothetical protein